MVGIYRPLHGGIVFVKQGKNVFAIASGGYDNEIDKPKNLIYSGAGEVTKEKPFEDQKFERGNLALFNNIVANFMYRLFVGINPRKLHIEIENLK